MKTILIHGYTGRFGQAIYHHLKDTYHVLGANQSTPIQTVLQSKTPDIILDVTNAKAIHTYLPLYLSLRIPTIIGTSGISPTQAKSLLKQANFPLMIVPNFSLSFLSFVQSARQLAQHAQQITIQETHHQRKLDSPSGSSLFLADILNTTTIESYRVNEYRTEHTIIFEHPTHQLSLSHRILSLSEFLPGVDTALQKIQQLEKGLLFF